MYTKFLGLLGVIGAIDAGMVRAEVASPEGGPSAKPLIGVNWAGAEFAPRNLPGVENRDYGWPTAESLDYWKSKGVVLIRLPFSWERLQPALNGEFDPDYLAGLTRSVALIRERDLRVLLDLHNYGKYRGQPIGSETVPVEAFADVWRRLAEVFKGDTSVCGYGLMNEPACKPWVDKVQAAIDAIRAVDAKTAIFVANDYAGWSASPQHIQRYGGEVGKRGDFAAWADERLPIGDPKLLRDPATNLVYEMHFYFDHDNSGTYKKTYEEEAARRDGPGVRVTPEIGVDRVRPFAAWVKKHNVRGFVGEFGVPANPGIDPRWLEALDNAVAFMQTNRLDCTYWAAGTRWTPGREYVIEPQGWSTALPPEERAKDRPQLNVLLKYLK
jgi:endoglucanase